MIDGDIRVMLIKDIKIGNRFRKEVGDIKALAQSINEIGLLHPVVINENSQLIAGARRLEACKLLGYEEISISIVNLKDLLKGEFHENALRKDFTISEAVAIKRAIEPEIESEAKEWIRMTQFGNYGSSDSDEPPTEHGRTDDKVAQYLGVGRDTLRKMENIVKAAEEDPDAFGHYLEDIDSGKTSINYINKVVERSKDHKAENILSLPEGLFDIIYADPPWEYDINTRGSPDEHYPIMRQKEIEDLKIPVAENAILFLWATSPKLPEAFSVIKSWGFKYKTSAVWIKDKIGTGYYFRGQHELLLVGEKGGMPVPQEKDRHSSVIEAPRAKHSEKPELVYELIEQMYPNRTYLELFARNKRDGWSSWGNEIEGQDFQLAIAPVVNKLTDKKSSNT